MITYLFVRYFSETHIHNENEVYTSYQKNGLKGLIMYKKNGVLHREDGPAVNHPIQRAINGNDFTFSYFWLNGISYDFGEWLKAVEDKISQEKYIRLKEKYG